LFSFDSGYCHIIGARVQSAEGAKVWGESTAANLKTFRHAYDGRPNNRYTVEDKRFMSTVHYQYIQYIVFYGS